MTTSCTGLRSLSPITGDTERIPEYSCSMLITLSVLMIRGDMLREMNYSSHFPGFFCGQSGPRTVPHGSAAKFSILITEPNPETLIQVAERIRKEIEKIRIPHGDRQLSITVSIGARIVDSTPGLSPPILIGDADKALYRSKTEGKNRSTLYIQGLLEKAFLLRNSS